MRFRKRIYLVWHHLHRPWGLRSSVVVTDEHEPSDREKSVRLIGFLKIHNEVRTGHLERVLRHMGELCTEIVVCDCESTDGSKELAMEYTDHVLSAPNDFKNEITTKQHMLEYALSLDPDWIIWLDADEVFERRGEVGGIRRLCVMGDEQGLEAFEFPELNLWKQDRQYRVDELWAKGSFVRLWKNTGKLRFETGEGLHRSQHPQGLNQVGRSDIAVIHYGFASEELIREKYHRYAAQGQHGFALDRLDPDDPGAKLRELDLDRVPTTALSITVVALIYRSTGYADFVYESFMRHSDGAEFCFVANDATESVVEHLRANDMPHVVFENPDPDEHYLNRVYRAWNHGGMSAPSDVIVFVNSDMAFSDGWLRNMLKHLQKDRVVCSRLVESGKMLSGQHGISKDFGRTYSDFRALEFETFAESVKKDELRTGGLFMPCMMYRQVFEESGGYPIGNRKNSDGSETSGDHILFYETLGSMGVDHITAFDSIVYHVQEGEMDE